MSLRWQQSARQAAEVPGPRIRQGDGQYSEVLNPVLLLMEALPQVVPVGDHLFFEARLGDAELLRSSSSIPDGGQRI